MTVTNDTAAWALEQMCRLETAVRELNEKTAELAQKNEALAVKLVNLTSMKIEQTRAKREDSPEALEAARRKGFQQTEADPRD